MINVDIQHLSVGCVFCFSVGLTLCTVHVTVFGFIYYREKENSSNGHFFFQVTLLSE